MKPIKNLLNGDQFESIRLASQILKITEYRIKKNIDSGKILRYKGKSYRFVEINWGDTSTKTKINKINKMPFGKYKGEIIEFMTDVPYMSWLIDNTDLDARLKIKLRARINFIQPPDYYEKKIKR